MLSLDVKGKWENGGLATGQWWVLIVKPFHLPYPAQVICPLWRGSYDGLSHQQEMIATSPNIVL